MSRDFEILVLELKLSKIIWLIIGTYKPPSLSDITLISKIQNIIDILLVYLLTHGNILLGDFDNPNYHISNNSNNIILTENYETR